MIEQVFWEYLLMDKSYIWKLFFLFLYQISFNKDNCFNLHKGKAMKGRLLTYTNDLP